MIRPTLDSPVIASKLHPPRLTAQHVSRPRLIDKLTAHGDRPLTLVCAPAGTGKSTLLSEWLTTSTMPSAWLSLDERDNDLAVFVSYVLATMRTVAPTPAFATHDLLQAVVPPPLAVLATSLSNDLDQIENDFLLVIDDYHLITNPEIDELVLRLLQHPPRGMHLAVATRVEPSWPLEAFRARGQLSQIRAGELQFTRAESAAFLRNELGDAITDDLLATLHEESEGWAAGLQLMSLSLNGQNPDAVRATMKDSDGEGIDAYMWDEVFFRQEPIVRNQLMRLSILERFSGSLCEAMYATAIGDDAPHGWGAGFLADLCEVNLFVVSLDPTDEFYRFHHLFQQFLQRRLREQFDEREIAALHQCASGWFAARGFIEEALHHALAAGNITEAAELVATHHLALYDQEQFARLARWLRLLPPVAKEHHPELLLAEARIASLSWRFTETAILLDQAQDELDSANFDSHRKALAAAELAILRGILDFWTGDVQRLESETRFALDVLPKDNYHLRGFAHTGLISSMYLRGNALCAQSYLDEQLSRTPSDSIAYAGLLHPLAFIHWLNGNLTSFHNEASRLLRLCTEFNLPEQRALAKYFLGVVHYARNDLGAAESYLTDAVSARFNLRLMSWVQAAGLLALLYGATERPEQARQTLLDANAFLLERHALRLLPNIGAFQAELDRRQGRLAEAIAWARQVDLLPLTWPLSVIEPRLEQALIWLSAGEPGQTEAELILAELRAFCERIPNRRFLLQVEALEVLMLARQGHDDEALKKLTHVVLAAEPEGWVRLFVDLGDDMASLLARLAQQQIAPYAIRRILDAFPGRHIATGSSDQSRLVEPLSERELEILALLGVRDSNKEIAARLFISPATVKRHTLSIYRKLGVNDRRDAVSCAIALGLLP